MARHIPQERKDEILLAVKNGSSVHEASATFSVSVKTIHAWLRGQTDNTGTSNLEIGKLRRENAELKEIIGWFTLKERRGEKNQGR